MRSVVRCGVALACGLLTLAAGAEQDGFTSEWLRPSPDARVVASSVDEDVRFEVPVARIARSGGLARPREVRRVEGRLASITWAWPRGSTSGAVHAALREQLSATPWFECAGRACGSASYWAHRVFGVPDLYGRDELQHYGAFPGRDGSALLLYVAERGTREVFAHLVEIVPAGGGDRRLVAAVAIPARASAASDPLPEALADALPELLARIGERPAHARLAVVVHAAPQGEGDPLGTSGRLATRFAEHLAQASGRSFEAHGVGALVPSVLGAAELRVEIVELEPGTP